MNPDPIPPDHRLIYRVRGTSSMKSRRLSRLETWIIAVLLFNVVLLILTLAADGMLTYALTLLR